MCGSGGLASQAETLFAAHAQVAAVTTLVQSRNAMCHILLPERSGQDVNTRWLIRR